MSIRLFISNFTFATTEEEIKALFEAYGDVEEVQILRDRNTGDSRGFGFVQLSEVSAGELAISALHLTRWGGREINVNLAHPRADRDVASSRTPPPLYTEGRERDREEYRSDRGKKSKRRRDRI